MINPIRRDAMEQHASPAQGNRPTDATPSLDDLLSPTGPYRLRVDELLADGAQLINGQWWQPQYGCDSLEHLLDLIRSRILPHLRPPVEGIDVPGPDGDWLDVYDLCIAEGVDVEAGARLLRRYQEALPAHALPLPTTTTTETTDFRSAQSPAERVVAAIPCNCWLDDEQPCPSRCVFDDPREEVNNCTYATMIESANKKKTDCKYYRVMTDFRVELQALFDAIEHMSAYCFDVEAWESALDRARAALASEPQAEEDDELPPRVGHILRLAEIIRKVDGNHDKGAAALAEAILSHPGSRWLPAEPAEPDERIQLSQVEKLASVKNSVSEGSDCDSEEVER